MTAFGRNATAQLKQLQQCHAAQPRELGRELLQRNWLTPYQVNKLLQGRGAELILGPYLLLERLGEGGAGQVFKARHLRMNRLVAIKVLRKEVVTDAEVLARFYREIQLVSQLNHPNIVRAFDAGPIGQSHVLVMEFVEGVDLGRRVRDGGLLPVDEACEYVRQAAVSLQHAHGKGLVRRDIKPNNLLLESPKPGRPAVRTIKVLDFGLARLQRTGPGNPASLITPLGATTMLGTPDYLAPEQALDFHAADIRADIYSLGCTLYYLLTGRAPFASVTLAETLLKHQQGEPAPVAQFRQDVPPWVIAVLGKMMAKRPPDRYQTPAEVAAALAEGPAAAVPSIAAANPPSRNRKRWAWVATALLVLALATGWIVWPKSSESRSGAPTRAGVPESEATILAVNPLPLRRPPVDLAGRKYYALADRRHPWRVQSQPVPHRGRSSLSSRWRSRSTTDCKLQSRARRFHEKSSKQRLHDGILNAFLVGQPDQPMGVESVWRPFDPVEGELNALLLADSDQPGIEFL
jgi:serine/threonine-protein kinase